MKVQFNVSPDLAGGRLDDILARRNPERSRSGWLGLINAGAVMVNGEPKKASYKVKSGDSILADVPAEKEAASMQAPDKTPEIIYQDDDVIVINKPYGLVVHATPEHPEPSVAGAYKDLIDDGADLRAGIVHRLDKDTSGVMILARSAAAREYLQAQFKAHTVQKVYVALLQGHLKDDSARIELPIGRNPKARHKMTVMASGKPSVSEYSVQSNYKDYDLVEVQLHTGRTHQIRVHFAHLGHAVVGDTTYGSAARPAGLKRQFLHAEKLTITLPSGETKTFIAPLAPDLAKFLKSIEEAE